jgi:hypothetical protein
VRVRVILILFGGIAGACGGSPGAGRNPKETVRNLETALRSADIGAVYDMLSERGQRELAAPFVGLKAALKSVPASQLKASGLAEYRDMDAREMLVASVERAKDANPKALDPLKSLTIAVMDVRQTGDRAAVRTSFLLRGRARDQTLYLVREAGLWKLESNDAMRGVPLPVAPTVDACSGPVP